MLATSAICAIASLAAPAWAQEAAESEIEEIVVVGRAPVRIAVQVDSQRRVRACEVTRSSGDPTFDRSTCETVAACSREKDRSRAAVQACTQAAMSGVLNDQSAGDGKQ